MAGPAFYARLTSATAAANELVVGNDPATLITFVPHDPDGAGPLVGDMFLEHNGGAPDPDTHVMVGGVSHSFTYYVVGTLPVNNKVPVALQGKLVAKIILDDGRIFFFVLDGSGTQALMNLIGNGNIRLENLDTTPPTTFVCFCTGTEILTPSGYRRVETLRAGDNVMNDRGEAKQLLWVGRSTVSADELRTHPDLRPVRIGADAIGPGRPAADLDVSPQHRVVLEGPEVELMFGVGRVLAAAKHLVGTMAEVVSPEADVTYFHLLFEDHEVLVSNGLATESFQPARRTIEAMTGESRDLLEQTLEALGLTAMLSRKDALRSLKRGEAMLLADALCQRSEAAPTTGASANGPASAAAV